MAFMERAKSAFEWLEHGKTAVEIGLWVIAALGGGRVVRAWLVQHTSIAMEWISPLWLMSSAIFLWLLLRFAPRINSHKQPTQTDSIQSASIANPATVTTQSVDEFYRTYDNVLLRECEDNVRTLANAFPAGNDRERFFLRFIASGMIGYVFDVVWYTIYKSQLDALLQLNSTSLTRGGIRPYYDAVAAAYPAVYREYSFDKWIGYMRTWVLIREDGDIISITVRGREFFKYLNTLGALCRQPSVLSFMRPWRSIPCIPNCRIQ